MNARIEQVGGYHSCMFSKVRILCQRSHRAVSGGKIVAQLRNMQRELLPQQHAQQTQAYSGIHLSGSTLPSLTLTRKLRRVISSVLRASRMYVNISHACILKYGFCVNRPTAPGLPIACTTCAAAWKWRYSSAPSARAASPQPPTMLPLLLLLVLRGGVVQTPMCHSSGGKALTLTNLNQKMKRSNGVCRHQQSRIRVR